MTMPSTIACAQLSPVEGSWVPSAMERADRPAAYSPGMGL